MKAFELELQRLTLQLALWELICFVVAMFVLYFVIKCAIRDGIRESGLVDRPRAWHQAVAAAHDKGPETLPDMRAER